MRYQSLSSLKGSQLMLLQSFTKAVQNLLNPGIWKIFLFCLLVYIAAGLAFAAGLGWVAAQFATSDHIPAYLSGLIAGAGGTVLAWFLFPLLYPVLMSFFDEAMAEKIERSDYPQLMRATPPFWPTFWHDVLFSLKAIALNLLFLPLYFIPLFGQLLYYGFNGYLLGAQFFRMSGGRRDSRATVEGLISQHRNKIILGGALIMLCATIPILNLAAPVLGVATMLHLYHALKGNNQVTIL